MAAPPPMFDVNLSNTFGALFIAVVFACMLFGVTNVQVYMYFRWYPEDPLPFRASVAILWIADALMLCFNVHAVYYYLCLNYGNVLVLLDVVWSLKAQLITTALMTPMIQSLYTLRVFKLRGEHRIIPGLLCVGLLGSWGTSLWTAVTASKLHTFFPDIKNATPVLNTYVAFLTGIDIFIASSLCFYLYQSSSSTFSKEDGLIKTLMVWIVGTGLLTSMCAIAMLATILAMPQSLVGLSLEMVGADLYINSYLAMLNARRMWRNRNSPGRRFFINSSSDRGQQRSTTQAGSGSRIEFHTKTQLSDQVFDLTSSQETNTNKTTV